MKKFLIALALGIVLVLAIATVASADNGPHGGFNGSTDACAGCHRIHSAISTDGMLLVQSDIYTLCTSCHDGTGAYTNVVDGFFDVDGVGRSSAGTLHPDKNAYLTSTQGDSSYGLFAGGFVNTRMLTDYGNAGNEALGNLAANTLNAGADQNTSTTSWAEMNAYDTSTAFPVVSRPTTSNHNVVTAARSGTVWGSGNYNPAGTLANQWGAALMTGATELECTSCHDPHGNAGRFPSAPGATTLVPYPSYRLLRYTPLNSGGYGVTSAVTTTGYWDTDLTWSVVAPATTVAGVSVPLLTATTTVAASSAGVFVPDPDVHWYTVNSDISNDPTLGAYTASNLNTEYALARFAGRGDYGGLYRAYKRPAQVMSTATSGITRNNPYVGCYNGGFTVGAGNTAALCTVGAAGPAFNNVAPHDVMGFWCSTCHDRYMAPSSTARTTDSGDPGYHYRHRAQTLTAVGTGTGATCVDCHNAHGTSATSNGLASSAETALAKNASYAGGSVLLKADNRAICTRCHASAVNFFNIVTSPAAFRFVVYP